MRSKQAWFVLTTVVCAVLLVLALVEAGLRLLQPASDRYLALPPNVSATFATAESGVEGPSEYRTNSLGVRGREFGVDRGAELRVLAMGGSTTEGLLTDQERVWTHLLERHLGQRPDGRRTWVGNIGQSGLSSRHHVVEARRLLRVYDPDIVTVLVGVNDLSSRLKGGDDYDPGYLDDPARVALAERQAFAVTPADAAGIRWADDPWWKRSRIWGLARSVKYQLLGRSLHQDTRGRNLAQWRKMRATGRRSDELPGLAEALDEYERNLRAIVDSIEAHGAVPLLMTQPVLWRADLEPEAEKRLWMGGVGDFRAKPGSLYYSPAALAEGMAAYNRRLLEVCADRVIPCLDLASQIPKTLDYFYDDCHFTDQGNRTVAAAVAAAMEMILASSATAAVESPR